MEIRDPVHGNITLSDEEASIVDTVEFQRLRAIKQLGFAEFSFPAATHNRYLHSIGVSHVAGIAFDQIFKTFSFSSQDIKARFRTVLKLASLLHDIGHGPLSHTTEDVMPLLKDLEIHIYKHREKRGLSTEANSSQRATHEDYSIKYITDSPIASHLKKLFCDISPYHICCLIDKSLQSGDDFFFDQGIDFRPLLSQLVSSEVDCDRMDYLERDSYFCGTNYGRFDLSWLVNNLTGYLVEEKMYLALNRRALYTFDDFLISRHHMHLMVYFHHKSIIYEEMLNKYLTSPDCSFFLPSDINEYTKYNDYRMFEHLMSSPNAWARRIVERKPFRVLIELHKTEENEQLKYLHQLLKDNQIEAIEASSKVRLSKYHTPSSEDRALQIYVVDQYNRWDNPVPIDQSTEIFKKYEGTRIIDRLYVAPEDYEKAEGLLLLNSPTKEEIK